MVTRSMTSSGATTRSVAELRTDDVRTRAPDAGARRGRDATWRRTVFFATDIFVATFWVVVMTTGVAVGFALLALGVGRAILRAVARLGAAADELSQRRASAALGVGIDAGGAVDATSHPAGVARALRGLGRSWLRFARAVATFCVASVIWLVPLSFVAVPVLVAADVEPRARIGSSGWDVSIDSWGAAIGCAAVGVMVLVLVPGWLRGLAIAHRRQGGTTARSLADTARSTS